ncbi:YkgJ family cysteine cluster protein [Allosphingosinicella flava]|uniref:YkgJ family cysteine cluster protein n=1 Tax=Allosphingosinicella flava TaxID=2771430 RepID=A0A7T2GKP0_9SPHN|nr:YkgJ family cysteine cluster protein [Sphingosinicella flava]QPQ55625.1 YkgJ family cysteine cluster protein [Sphingosinicella flava]
MNQRVRRFACTQCGKCCDRSPEVSLSEAAALADIFVFRLMFRLYWLPRRLSDYLANDDTPANASAAFYEKKRLLSAFAARKSQAKVRRDGKSIDYTKYLMISALALDTNSGACSALNGNRCGIYDRRPLSCRTVPFHYSRVEALSEAVLETFVETPGYRCDTGETAGIVLEDGRIVVSQIKTARDEAIMSAARDQHWGQAIVRRMNIASPDARILPTLEEVEANAQFAATTVSMLPAWRTAADMGIMSMEECRKLTALQIDVVGQELDAGRALRMRGKHWSTCGRSIGAI